MFLTRYFFEGDILYLKCYSKINKIKVFLSSSMQNEKYKEQRDIIDNYFSRMPLFDCFLIENNASPQDVKTNYRNEVKESDIIILILQNDLRQGVYDEYQTAIANKKRILAYIHSGQKKQKLKNFIKSDLQENVTTYTFSEISELIDKIEEGLFKDIIRIYKNYTIFIEKSEETQITSNSEVRKF